MRTACQGHNPQHRSVCFLSIHLKNRNRSTSASAPTTSRNGWFRHRKNDENCLRPVKTDILCENSLPDVTRQQPLASTHIKPYNYTTPSLIFQEFFIRHNTDFLQYFLLFFIHHKQKIPSFLKKCSFFLRLFIRNSVFFHFRVVFLVLNPIKGTAKRNKNRSHRTRTFLSSAGAIFPSLYIMRTHRCE